ncbi:hypothetical protein DPX16_7919 [Anabarilius grahami]|uniref:Uncharacterized protein n=1 Tax=Anabarilius grahami TaxID=495550 RepID=A0A3N0Y7P9_ANAGA|nr:hypothetical protein DPX16_7919 [Anabarilius grahami]
MVVCCPVETVLQYLVLPSLKCFGDVRPEESVNISTYSYPVQRAECSGIPQDLLSARSQEPRKQRDSKGRKGANYSKTIHMHPNFCSGRIAGKHLRSIFEERSTNDMSLNDKRPRREK